MPDIKHLHIDCMDYLASLPDKENNSRRILVISDPPYGIGEDGSNNKGRTNKRSSRGAKNTRKTLIKSKDYKPYECGDNNAPGVEYFNEIKRISVNQIVWGANHFIENIPDANSSCWIVWDKENGLNDFADCELAWTSFKTAVRRFKFKWHGMLQGDMKNKQERIHPNEKPIQLWKYLLTNYAKEGDLIVDTHAGSCKIAIAAYDLGFDCVVCEKDKYYYDLGKADFEKHVAKYSPASEIEFNSEGQIKLF